MQEKKKILVIDGNSILNRAFYGVKPLSTRDGRPTNAIFGFVNIIMKAVESLMPDAVGVAFDLKAPTFRHKKYSLYKANRHGMPDELRAQLQPVKDISEKLGFHVLSLEGYEADDILGTAARLSDKGGHECYVLTGDRDSLQLISDSTVVLLATNTETVHYDREKFAENYGGLTPEKLIDLKALMGDSSDNIPGIPGVGEKTALKLISEYGSLDGLYENFENSSLSPKMKEKIRDGKESAYLSFDLATIFREVPLELGFEALSRSDIDKAGLYGLFSDLELRGFITRFGLDSTEEGNSAPPDEEKKFTDYRCTDIYDGSTGKTIYVHPDFEDGKLYCDNGEKLVIPVTDNNLKCIFEECDGCVLYDSKQVSSELLERGIELKNCIFDLKLAAYLCDPSAKNEAENLSGLAKSESADRNDKVQNNFALLLAMPYLHDYFSKLLSDYKADKLYFETELPLALTLSKMEKEGMSLDAEGLRRYNVELEARIATRQKNIYDLAGCEFNINSPKQLGEVLFEKLGLPGIKKTKSGFSTDAETLEHLRPYHPVINEILDYRTVSKLKSTYGDGLLSALSDDGRLHTNFRHAYTQTGRLSSAEPNLQNIPIKTAEGRELRKFFVAKNDEYCLIDADYSQIELRILAALSKDKTMVETFLSGGDIHTTTASQVFGVAKEDVTPEMRKSAKAVNFGIVYGISDFSLAGDIGVTRKEAAAYIEGYFAKYPDVKRYLEELCENAASDGYVTTLYGRRRNIPELQSPKKTLQALGKRLAMNTPIQGTAADIIKMAMVKTEKALAESGLCAKLILQVHDELIVEVKKEDAQKAAELLKACMESAAELCVPLSVEVNIADNWFEAH